MGSHRAWRVKWENFPLISCATDSKSSHFADALSKEALKCLESAVRCSRKTQGRDENASSALASSPSPRGPWSFIHLWSHYKGLLRPALASKHTRRFRFASLITNLECADGCLGNTSQKGSGRGEIKRADPHPPPGLRSTGFCLFVCLFFKVLLKDWESLHLLHYSLNIEREPNKHGDCDRVTHINYCKT